jgi:hypothetical protein
VLDELAEQAARDVGEREVAVDGDAGVGHGYPIRSGH